MTRTTSIHPLPTGALLSALFLALPFTAGAAQEVPLARTHAEASLNWGACPDFMPKGCEIAVLHGDPGKDNADVFFKVPGGAAIPRHWHTSAERMVLVAGELDVTYDGNAAVALKPGAYAYGPPRLPHSGVCKSTTPCVLFIAFEAPVDAVAGEPPAK